MISKKYGAWIILISCFIIGIFTGNDIDIKVLLLLSTIISGFLLHHILNIYVKAVKHSKHTKHLTIFYALIFLGSGALLIIYYKLTWLLFFGTISLLSFLITLLSAKHNKELTIMSETIGILGLSAVAPSSEYCTTSVFSEKTIEVWLLCFLFFCGSIFHIRYIVRKRGELGKKFSIRIKNGISSIIYNILTIIIVYNFISKYAVIVFMPTITKSILPVFMKLKPPSVIKHIGYSEAVNTAIFLILILLMYKYIML